MEEKLLEVRHLKKYFHTPAGLLHAVDDVDFSIPKGKTMGVVGESGCGKSTLGRSLLCLEPPTAGEILFEGKNIAALSKREMKKVRPKIQMVFQDPYSSLNGRMTVRQLIAEPLLVNKICKNRAEVDQKVDEMMETVGLAKRLDMAYPHELDGGRRQRIGIARALILNPEFVVCDEPVSALDVSIQAQILNLLMDLQESMNLTYMFITHDLSVVRHISNEIMVMYLGKVVESAPARELCANPGHPYTQALLSAVPTLAPNRKKRIILTGDVPSPLNPPHGCRFHPRCPFARPVCAEKEPELTAPASNPAHFCACHFAFGKP